MNIIDLTLVICTNVLLRNPDLLLHVMQGTEKNDSSFEKSLAARRFNVMKGSSIAR